MLSDFEQLDLLLSGSWTSFKKLAWFVDIEKCCQEYFLVITSPPEYPDCSNYLDNLIDMINNIEISHNYEHTDEMI